MDEYEKARSTGVADMSKAGAAEGLLARKRMQESQKQNLNRQQYSGEMTSAGHKIGIFLILAFPFLALFGGTLEIGINIGIKLGLGEKFDDFPAWYQALTLPVPIALTGLLFWFRRIAIPVFYVLLIAGLAFYELVLSPG
ncbi:MAG: hypothetical protein HND56_06480 [Pseudomonadota bacterium]|jgi:hypothetical protein|nr:hypothetical protein [Pseudomonadota bacterium]QKK05350.1 MAG: hypothetical protein HND56_06480 [Pseudomonadota bacterium]